MSCCLLKFMKSSIPPNYFFIYSNLLMVFWNWLILTIFLWSSGIWKIFFLLFWKPDYGGRFVKKSSSFEIKMSSSSGINIYCTYFFYSSIDGMYSFLKYLWFSSWDDINSINHSVFGWWDESNFKSNYKSLMILSTSEIMWLFKGFFGHGRSLIWEYLGQYTSPFFTFSIHCIVTIEEFIFGK